jgi:hypothetical protein
VRLKRVNNYLSEEVNQIVESASYRRHEPRLLGLDGRPVVQRGLLLRPIKVPVLPLGSVQRHIYQCRVLVHHHDVDFSGHVTVGVNFQFVHSRHQNPPELSVLGRLEAHVSGLHLEGSLLNRITVLVHDETVNAPVCFGEEFDQRHAVVLPILGEFVGGRIFTARDFQSDFHATVPDVIEVLHAAGQRIPLSPIRYTLKASSGDTNVNK